MLTVTMYKNFAKKSNSTKQPDSNVDHTDFSCSLKDDCTVLSPVIDIYVATGDPVALGYNYAYIPAYSRFYWVDEWSYTMGIWTARMSVDVLASYKTEIGNENHYVLRASNAYTIDSAAVRIPDTLYPSTHSKMTVTTGMNLADRPFIYTNGSYVIGIINGGNMTNLNSQGTTKYYVASANEIKTIISYLLDNTFASNYLEDSSVGLSDAAVKNFVDPLQYIASFQWFPFQVAKASTAERPKMGFWDTTNDNGIPTLYPVANTVQLIQNQSLTIYKNPHRLEAGKEFTDFPPYISYRLRFDPFGVFELDSGLMCGRADNNPLYMSMTVDLVTGLAKLDVSASVQGGCDLVSAVGQVGVDIQLSQVTQDVLSAGYGKWNQIGNSIAGWIGDKLGMEDFAGSTAKTLSKGTGIVSSLGLTGNLSYTRQGINGSLLSYEGYNTSPMLITTYYDVVGVDPVEYGQPLCKRVTINTCSGFVICGDVETEAGILAEEKASINAFLTGGFYYE